MTGVDVGVRVGVAVMVGVGVGVGVFVSVGKGVADGVWERTITAGGFARDEHPVNRVQAIRKNQGVERIVNITISFLV